MAVESESKQCPTCGRYSPSSAIRCDCGYDFVTRSVSTSHRSADQQVGQPGESGNAARTAIGCLGLFCAMLGYVLTIGFADMFYASTGRQPLDPTGGLGMMLGIGPPAWIAFAIAVVLASQRKSFVWIAGSGVLVALASLAVSWLAFGGWTK